MKPTREQCLKWAEEAGLDTPFDFELDVPAIEALCQRVWNEAITAEREECAKVCESMSWSGRSETALAKDEAAEECAAAIRARSEK